VDSVRERSTLYCLFLGAVVIGVAVVLAVREPAPALVPLIIFGGLFALAENKAVSISDHMEATSGLMLGMAAIVVFDHLGSLLGALLVGVFAGLYWPQIAARDWRKIVVNSANDGLAMVAAAVVYGLIASPSGGPLEMVLIALPTAVAYAIVNVLLVSTATFVWTGEWPSSTYRTLGSVLLQMYPFALLGLFLGRLYLDYGPVLVPLFVVPILVARQAFASYLAIKESQEAAVRTLIGALEAKDPYTAGHAERVAGYASYIGTELGMSPTRLERLRFAALMHDVGKLVVPNHLLNKKGKLTAEEFAQVRLHEEVSVQILTRIDFLAPVAPSATSEAAEFSPVADDRGQPIEPHIVAVADAFDAMTSTRSYRRALPQQTAFDELRKNSGKQFHPRVVDALIVAIKRRGEHHGAGYEEVVHHEDAPEAGTGSAGLGDLVPELGALPDLGGAAPAAGR
jgi:hypothetical protein